MEKPLEPVLWGVLGVADIATQKVIPAMQGSQLSIVHGIASRSEERSSDAASALGIPRSYGSYEALLADPDIEAVYIPLPNHLHPVWTEAAARAGKHVLCEKPMAMTAPDAQHMIDVCRAAGVKLMEGFMYRHHPMWKEIRRLVAGGAIGELAAIQAFFSYYNDDPDNIRNSVAFGGGALYDIGCYPVSVARLLFGSEPTVVDAAIKRDPDSGVDVVTSAVLDFDGRHATFTCSTRMEPDQRVHIQGSHGRILVEIPFNIPPDRPTRFHLFSGGEPPVAPRVETEEIEAADQYGIQADLFSKAIREDLPVPTPPEDGVANLVVLERIFEAARTGDRPG